MSIKLEFRVYGDTQLYAKLKGNVKPADIKRVVRHSGMLLTQTMKRKAEFRGHFENGRFVKPTGTTKRSIHMAIRDAGFTVAVGPTTSYAECVEYGTRFMTAQPFARPAFEEVKPKFLHDLQKLVKN